ncbi:hypothetical protein BJX64DRAFT_289959 [Aspergillus heterothallicus]
MAQESSGPAGKGHADEVSEIQPSNGNSQHSPQQGQSNGSSASPGDDPAQQQPRFSQLISNETHSKSTFRGFRGIPFCCGGVDVQIKITHDNVPFLFTGDSHIQRLMRNDLEDLDWGRVITRVSQKGTDPLELRHLLLEMKARRNDGLVVYLNIKSKRPPGEIEQAISAVYTPEDYPTETWKHRIVICVPDARYIPPFDPSRFKIALRPRHVKYGREILDRNTGVHLKIDCKVSSFSRGKDLINHAKQLGREVYLEGVNEDYWMEWCLKENINGIITDRVSDLDELLCKRNTNQQTQGAIQTSPVIPKREIMKGSVRTVKDRGAARIYGNRGSENNQQQIGNAQPAAPGNPAPINPQATPNLPRRKRVIDFLRGPVFALPSGVAMPM